MHDWKLKLKTFKFYFPLLYNKLLIYYYYYMKIIMAYHFVSIYQQYILIFRKNIIFYIIQLKNYNVF